MSAYWHSLEPSEAVRLSDGTQLRNMSDQRLYWSREPATSSVPLVVELELRQVRTDAALMAELLCNMIELVPEMRALDHVQRTLDVAARYREQVAAADGQGVHGG